MRGGLERAGGSGARLALAPPQLLASLAVGGRGAERVAVYLARPDDGWVCWCHPLFTRVTFSSDKSAHLPQQNLRVDAGGLVRGRAVEVPVGNCGAGRRMRVSRSVFSRWSLNKPILGLVYGNCDPRMTGWRKTTKKRRGLSLFWLPCRSLEGFSFLPSLPLLPRTIGDGAYRALDGARLAAQVAVVAACSTAGERGGVESMS